MGLLNKGMANKQSRIKSIMWHLRWLVRTRADISLPPSARGSIRPKTDIKLRPSVLVRTGTDIKLLPIGLVSHTRTDTRANIHANLFKLSLSRFLGSTNHTKK